MKLLEDIDLLISHCRMMEYDFLEYKLINLKTKIMSISTPMGENPVKKYIECRSDEKRFTYFDKSKGESGERVEIPLPFYVTVLDELATISGYNEANGCGFKSNEVHSTKKEPLVVKTWKGDFKAEGLYSDIKAKCKEAGGRFTRSIYALLSVSKTEKELVNIQLKGTPNSQWIELGARPGQHIVKFCEEWKEGSKGKTTYNMPVMELIPITPELLTEGIKVDTEILQPYLLQRGGGDERHETDLPDVEGDDTPKVVNEPQKPIKDLPF